jgi:hypothetical protein
MSSTTNAQKFVAALVAPMRDVETMWHQMRAMRDLRFSIGVWLEVLGKLVGRKREGISDDEIYRRLIRAQIATNKSNGLIDELLVIADLVVFDADTDYVVDNWGGGGLVLRIEDKALDWAIASLLIGLLRKAVLGAVRIRLDFVVEQGQDDYARAFRFSSVSSSGAGVGGYGSVSDPTAGGELAAGIE